jgi:hypothetical protein
VFLRGRFRSRFGNWSCSTIRKSSHFVKTLMAIEGIITRDVKDVLEVV